jgi:hypothetical protein
MLFSKEYFSTATHPAKNISIFTANSFYEPFIQLHSVVFMFPPGNYPERGKTTPGFRLFHVF